jgi:hypothetical protein
MTDISVIIPVNDTRQLSDLFFTQWYEQTVKMDKFELIIITSNEEQFKFINHLYKKTLHLKPDDLELHFLNEDIQQSRAKAMNLGIKKSKSSLLYFFGDDNIPTKKTITQHLLFHQYNPSAINVGIGLAFIPDEFKNEFVNWLEVSGSLFGIPFKQDEIKIPPNFFLHGEYFHQKRICYPGRSI